MQLSAIAVPTSTAVVPLDTPIATIEFAKADGTRITQPAFAGITGYEDPETPFVPVGSYDEAVEVAQGFATDVEGYPAHAVLQAADGAYYVTRLQQSPEDTGSINIDGEGYEDDGYTGFTVSSRAAAVQAIVGGEQVVDLRSA